MLTPQDQVIVVNASFRTGVGNAIRRQLPAPAESLGGDRLRQG